MCMPPRETTHTSLSLKRKKPQAGQPERPASKRQEGGANEGDWGAEWVTAATAELLGTHAGH